MIAEARDYGTQILRQEDWEKYWYVGYKAPKELALTKLSSRTIFILCYGVDPVLRFFAGAMTRILHTTGTKEDILWKACNPEYRVNFLKCLKEFPDDWARAFHAYESERHKSGGSLSTSNVDKESSDIGKTPFQIISSVMIGSQTFTCDSILALITPETFIFILPIEGAVWWHFKYIEVPTRYITHPTRRVTEEVKAHKHALIISSDPAGYFMINGKKNRLSGSIIYITSDHELTELYETCKMAFNQGQVARRPSSTFVTLDTAAEVAMKSSQYHEESSQVSQQCQRTTSQSLHSKKISISPGNRQEDLETGSKLVRDISTNKNPPSTMKHGIITADEAGRTSQLGSTAGKTTETPNGSDVQFQVTTQPAHDPNTPKHKFQNEGPVTGVNVRPNSEPKTAAAGDGTSPIVAKPTPCETQETGSDRTNKEVPPKDTSRKCSTRGRHSSNREGRTTLPDTQESLVFHAARRSNRNVYKRNSKAAVDWEEDLRPTPKRDEGEPENEIQKDVEVTSVSSPSPGNTSIFAKPSRTLQKRRNYQAASSTKTNQTRKKRVARKGGNKMPSLPLQTTDATGDNSNIKATKSDEGGKESLKTNNNANKENSNEAENHLDIASPNRPDNTACTIEERVNSSPENDKGDFSGALHERRGQGSNCSKALKRFHIVDPPPFYKSQNDEIESARTQTTAGAKSDSYHSELEKTDLASSNEKRSLVHDSMGDKKASKFHNAGHIPGHEALHQPETESIPSEAKECSQEEKKDTKAAKFTSGSSGIKPNGKHLAPLFKDYQSKVLDSEMETNLSSLHTPTHEEQTLTPRKSIVDENGSPRLVPRQPNKDVDFDRKRTFLRSEGATCLEDTSSQSGHSGDADGEYTDKSMSYASSISAPLKKRRAYLPDSPSRDNSSPISVSGDELKDIDFSNIKRRVPAIGIPERCATGHERTVGAVITPFSISGSPHRNNSTFEARCDRRVPKTSIPRPYPSIGSVRLEQELLQLDGDRETRNGGTILQGSLETVQKATQDMLLGISKVSSATSIDIIETY